MNSDEIDQKQLKTYRDDFLKLSRLRSSRMESTLSPRQVDRLKLLPLLFHVNHPMLPGYVDKFTPHGLPNYSPSKLEKRLAKSVSQSFIYKPRVTLSYKISSLFLMGSMGTLGQSSSSDLDLWICLPDPLSPASLTKLKQKAELIKQWTAQIGIELNYYCVNEDDFSRNKKKAIDIDSCGNTQNYLLLDEFYRTSVWIAGRWPLWWLIGQQHDYTKYAKRLVRQKHIDAADWIDFGEVKQIPVSEYFSAALWQLYKAIDSPYKSSVKLLVLEVYAQLHPCGGVLSNQLKINVHEGDVLNQELDPYLQILLFAEKSLKDNPKRLEFLRRAFYLKASVKVVDKRKSRASWRYQMIAELVAGWGWSAERTKYLNNREVWNIHQIKSERSDLIKELTSSYHFLSGFSRMQGIIGQVAKNELLSLGRRLYSNFERRNGKIEKLNTGIVTDTFEPAITLFQHQGRWSLYTGHIQRSTCKLQQVAFEGVSLFESLCWGCANGVISPATRLHVYQQDAYLNLELANDLCKDLFELLNHFEGLSGKQQFDDKAEIIGFGIFINTEIDPLGHEKQENVYQVANRADCFSWAVSKTNLVRQFEVVLINSWGEITTQCYSQKSGWIEFFTEYHDSINLSDDEFPIYCRRLIQKNQVIGRIREVLKTWGNLLLNSHRTNSANRHLMTLGKSTQLVEFYQSRISYDNYQSQAKLFDGLALGVTDENGSIICKTHLDPWLQLSEFCRAVINRRLPQGLDFYVSPQNNDSIEVLVRSFDGCLHFQRHKKTSRDQIIGHYQHFFDKIQNRNLLNHGLLEDINLFEFSSSIGKKKARFKSVRLQPASVMQRFGLVQAMAVVKQPGAATTSSGTINPNQIGFHLYTADTSYNYLEHGENVYDKLQKQLLKMRKKGTKYPIFLTDIDMSAVFSQVSIIQALGFKKKIESKLNKGL
ncbi:MAG: class I adenylate cyclase [Kangiellaceae bacterium]|nr:class I adenylate cyclase [Kangiellaceae bacterium]